MKNINIDRSAPLTTVGGKVPIEHKILLLEQAAKNNMGISEYVAYLLMSHCIDCQKNGESKERGGSIWDKKIIDVATEMNEPPAAIKSMREDEAERENFRKWRREKRTKPEIHERDGSIFISGSLKWLSEKELREFSLELKEACKGKNDKHYFTFLESLEKAHKVKIPRA